MVFFEATYQWYFQDFLQYNKSWMIAHNDANDNHLQCKRILRFTHCFFLNSTNYERRSSIKPRIFHKFLNNSSFRIFPLTVYPTFAIFRMPQIMGYNYDSANYAGQFVRKLPLPCSRVEIRQKWIETEVGMRDFIITGGSFRSRAWRVAARCSPSSRENAPAYFQSSNLN